MLTARRPLTLHETILGISQTRWNYWFTYAIDLSLMTFFLAWDAVWLGVTAGWMAPSYMLGLAAWSLTEYIFHRCVYHLEWGILSHGHETHHKDPRAYVAMPWFVTPILFIPPQLLVANYFGVRDSRPSWPGGSAASSPTASCTTACTTTTSASAGTGISSHNTGSIMLVRSRTSASRRDTGIACSGPSSPGKSAPGSTSTMERGRGVSPR